MNKYQEEFDLVRRLCELDGRERTILNYGIEEGRAKAIDEFAEKMKELCNGITFAELFIDEIAEQLKEGGRYD